MTEKKTKELKLRSCEQIFYYTTPILNFDRARPEIVATGVLVRVDDYHFVITASHLFEDPIRKIAFGYLRDGHFKLFGADASKLKILVAKPVSGAGNLRKVKYKDDLDLAIIETPPELLRQLASHYRFFDLRAADYKPSIEWGVVSGWPERANVYDRKKRICKFRSCYHIQCPIADPETIRRAGWNPDIHIGLMANKAKDFVSEVSGKKIQLPSLNGVSGSGMWVHSSVPNGKSAPHDWALAGIVVEDDAPNRLLKVIKIHHLWTLLFWFWKLQP